MSVGNGGESSSTTHSGYGSLISSSRRVLQSIDDTKKQTRDNIKKYFHGIKGKVHKSRIPQFVITSSHATHVKRT